MSKKSVASFSVIYYKVRCIIFDESSSKSSHSSKITYCSRLHPYDATLSVFETIFCENMFDFLKPFAVMRQGMFTLGTETATM